MSKLSLLILRPCGSGVEICCDPVFFNGYPHIAYKYSKWNLHRTKHHLIKTSMELSTLFLYRGGRQRKMYWFFSARKQHPWLLRLCLSANSSTLIVLLNKRTEISLQMKLVDSRFFMKLDYLAGMIFSRPRFAQYFIKAWCPGRVIDSTQRPLCAVHWTRRSKRKSKRQVSFWGFRSSDFPAVGGLRLSLKSTPGDQSAVIHHVLERRSKSRAKLRRSSRRTSHCCQYRHCISGYGLDAIIICADWTALDSRIRKAARALLSFLNKSIVFASWRMYTGKSFPLRMVSMSL